MITMPEGSVGSEEALYNIGVVTRMTGISTATLRAWERRYSFPESERTAGGHRLYSEMDVLRLRWVKEHIDFGMQTAQAIQALRRQEQTGSLPMVEPLTSAADPLSKPRPHPPVAPHLPLVKASLVDALLQQDLERAETILAEVLAVSNPEELILNIIGPALDDIGNKWENGGVDVATEHLTTNFLRQRLLMWMAASPPPRAVDPILLACAPNEWHEGSLLILGALLRRRRWPVSYLGQAVPLVDLASIVEKSHPSMIVLVAMTEASAAELSEWPQWLPKAAQFGKPPVGYGGRIFKIQPEWQLRMAGKYLGDSFEDGLIKIEQIMESLH